MEKDQVSNNETESAQPSMAQGSESVDLPDKKSSRATIEEKERVPDKEVRKGVVLEDKGIDRKHESGGDHEDDPDRVDVDVQEGGKPIDSPVIVDKLAHDEQLVEAKQDSSPSNSKEEYVVVKQELSPEFENIEPVAVDSGEADSTSENKDGTGGSKRIEDTELDGLEKKETSSVVIDSGGAESRGDKQEAGSSDNIAHIAQVSVEQKVTSAVAIDSGGADSTREEQEAGSSEKIENIIQDGVEEKDKSKENGSEKMPLDGVENIPNLGNTQIEQSEYNSTNHQAKVVLKVPGEEEENLKGNDRDQVSHRRIEINVKTEDLKVIERTEEKRSNPQACVDFKDPGEEKFVERIRIENNHTFGDADKDLKANSVESDQRQGLLLGLLAIAAVSATIFALYSFAKE